MKVLRTFLIFCGVLFVGAAGLVGYAGYGALEAKRESHAFVESLLKDYAATWRADVIADRVSPTHLEELRQLEVNPGFQEITKLGRLMKLEEPQWVHHTVTPGGSSTVVVAAGEFENGRAKVQAVIAGEQALRKLSGLRIVLDGPIKTTKIKL